MTAPTTYNLTPRTKVIRAAAVRPGHIVIESHEHPAVVVQVVHIGAVRVRLRCRYVWSTPSEPAWAMDDMDADTPIEISKEN